MTLVMSFRSGAVREVCCIEEFGSRREICQAGAKPKSTHATTEIMKCEALEKLDRSAGEVARVPAERVHGRGPMNNCDGINARSRPKTMNRSEQKIRKYLRMSSALLVGA